MDREELGKLVRQVWVEYCVEIGDTKPSHIAPWEELSEVDREADRRIGERVRAAVCADLLDVADYKLWMDKELC